MALFFSHSIYFNEIDISVQNGLGRFAWPPFCPSFCFHTCAGSGRYCRADCWPQLVERWYGHRFSHTNSSPYFLAAYRKTFLTVVESLIFYSSLAGLSIGGSTVRLLYDDSLLSLRLVAKRLLSGFLVGFLVGVSIQSFFPSEYLGCAVVVSSITARETTAIFIRWVRKIDLSSYTKK
jgi:hypothetical protein